MTGQHSVRAILTRLSLSLKKIKTWKTPHVQQEFTSTRSNTPWLRSLDTKLWRLQIKMDFDWKLLHPKISQPQCSHDNTNWTSGWAYFQWPCMKFVPCNRFRSQGILIRLQIALKLLLMPAEAVHIIIYCWSSLHVHCMPESHLKYLDFRVLLYHTKYYLKRNSLVWRTYTDLTKA